MQQKYYDDAYNATDGTLANVTAFNPSAAMVIAMNRTRNMSFDLPPIPTDVERCFVCCCESNPWEYNTVCMPKRKIPTFCHGGTEDAKECGDAYLCEAGGGVCKTSHPFIACYESKFVPTCEKGT
jgi:hypothetical protein